MRTTSSFFVLLALACQPRADERASTPPAARETEVPSFPRVGDVAPDFVLFTSTGERVALADATALGPVVLVFGSFT